MSTGGHSSTGNMMEFKFDTITTKKVKFVFKEAHDGWASASEFWFYKEDKMIDKLNTLFKNSNMNEINEEFNSVDKLNELEQEAKTHPFYENFKEDIDNAKLILENKEIQYTDTKVSKFEEMTYKNVSKYDKKYKLPSEQITKITTNGSHYGNCCF